MSNQAKWLIGIVVLVAFGMLVIHTPVGMWAQAKRLEERLAARTASQLNDAGVDWVHVDMRGQKAVLLGTAPTRDSVADARLAAARAAGPGAILFGGVTKVDTQGVDVPPPFVGPYEWLARLEPTALTLSGLVPTDTDASALLDRAALLFPGRSIINELKASPHAPTDDWLDLVEVGIAALGELRFGEAAIIDDTLRISGEAPSQEGLEAVSLAVAPVANRFIVATAVTAPAPPPLPDPEPEPEADPEPLFSALDRFVLDQPAAPVIEPEPIEEEPEPPVEEVPAEIIEEAVVEETEIEEIAPIDTAIECQERFDTTLEGQTIQFAIASARISTESHPLLNELAAVAKACSSFTIGIEGHTDATGSEEFNLELSSNRAFEVFEYLRNAGVPIDRMNANGYGSSQPVGPNNTASGRQQNRRIGFTVSE